MLIAFWNDRTPVRTKVATAFMSAAVAANVGLAAPGRRVLDMFSRYAA
jgi:hypothetical protein